MRELLKLNQNSKELILSSILRRSKLSAWDPDVILWEEISKNKIEGPYWRSEIIEKNGKKLSFELFFTVLQGYGLWVYEEGSDGNYKMSIEILTGNVPFLRMRGVELNYLKQLLNTVKGIQAEKVRGNMELEEASLNNNKENTIKTIIGGGFKL
jgi:hypothetical protein